MPLSNSNKILMPNSKHKIKNNLLALYMWNKHLSNNNSDQNTQFISACAGKPTFPLNSSVKESALKYWSSHTSAIDYGDMGTEKELRSIAADALNRWYDNTIFFNQNNILFTVGGTMGLNAIFHAIKKLFKDKPLISTMPYYPLYKGRPNNSFENNLHLIDLKSSNYTITANQLESGLKSINSPAGFLFCDPNNPSGTTPGYNEWVKISKILENYPEAPIILDEAYAEMVYDGKHESLITVNPNLHSRIVLLRSGTKGLSSAGERLALIATKNSDLLFHAKNFTSDYYLHPPISNQYIYAHALKSFSDESALQISKYYSPKIDKIYDFILKKNWHITPKPRGTFYNIVKLEHLLGKKIHPQAASLLETDNIKTDVHIAYHLLFEEKLAIAPLSFFGFSPTDAALRITCCDPLDILQKLINRLEKTDT